MEEKEIYKFILDVNSGAEEGWNIVQFLEDLGYSRNEIPKKFNEASQYFMNKELNEKI